jgi:glutathione reductase (NADPH)
LRKSTFFVVILLIHQCLQVGSIGLTEAEAVAKYGADKVTVYETAFTAMYFALTTRKQVIGVQEYITGHKTKRFLTAMYFAVTTRKQVEGVQEYITSHNRTWSSPLCTLPSPQESR